MRQWMHQKGVPMALTVAELAEEVRRSNDKIAEALRDLRVDFHAVRTEFTEFRVEMADKLGAVNTNLESFRGSTTGNLQAAKLEVTEKLGSINATLESFKSSTTTSLSVAKWGATTD